MRPTSQHSAALFGQPAPDFTFDLTPEVKVKLLTGDIRQQAADAIVNPCNDTMLQGLSAVSRSIFEVAGKDLIAECEQFLQRKGRLDLAEVMHTTAGWYTERTTRWILLNLATQNYQTKLCTLTEGVTTPSHWHLEYQLILDRNSEYPLIS